MSCSRFEPVTASCAPCCAVCGHLGLNCMGEKSAAASDCSADNGRVERILTDSFSASILQREEEKRKYEP